MQVCSKSKVCSFSLSLTDLSISLKRLALSTLSSNTVASASRAWCQWRPHTYPLVYQCYHHACVQPLWSFFHRQASSSYGVPHVFLAILPLNCSSSTPSRSTRQSSSALTATVRSRLTKEGTNTRNRSTQITSAPTAAVRSRLKKEETNTRRQSTQVTSALTVTAGS